MRRCAILLALVLAPSLGAQVRPDALHYPFDLVPGSAPNRAVPGAGAANALIYDHAIGERGQFLTALVGAGGTSDDAHVDTGWVTDLGASSWTLSFWLDLSVAPNPQAFGYLFGDVSAGGFRAFVNGAGALGLGGVRTVVLRGPFADVPVGIGDPALGGRRIAFVHDAVAGEIRAYVDEVLTTIVPQATLSIQGVGPFLVGGYATAAALPQGMRLDEFRVWRRALDPLELTAYGDTYLASDFLGASSYQPNSVELGLFATRGVIVGSAPTRLLLAPGSVGELLLSGSNIQVPIDLGIASGQPLPRERGALETLDGQVMNLDPLASSFLLAFGGFGFVPSQSFALPFVAPAGLLVSTQAIGLDPSQPAGIRLTQAIVVSSF